MDWRIFWKGFIIGIVTLMLLVFFVYNKYAIQPDISLDQISVQDLDGQKVELTEFIGKPIVVNYWATWCAPCVKEFTYFNKAKNELGDSVAFIMISDEPSNTILKFKNSNNFNFKYLHTNSKFSDYGINTLPTTYFYNQKGKMLNKHTGGLSEEKLKELISEIK